MDKKETKEPRKPFPWRYIAAALLWVLLAAIIAVFVYGWVRNNNEIINGYTVDATSTQVTAVKAVSDEWKQLTFFAIHASWVGFLLFLGLATLTNSKRVSVILPASLIAVTLAFSFASIMMSAVHVDYDDTSLDIASEADIVYEKGERASGHSNYSNYVSVPDDGEAKMVQVRAFKESSLESGGYMLSREGNTVTLELVQK